METGTGSGPSRLVRTAVRALAAALAVTRQHRSRPELCQKARLHAARALEAATRGGPVTLALHAGAVHFAGQPLLAFHADDAPFGPLRGAGIGELRLAGDLSLAVAEGLIDRLLAMPTGDGAETSLAAWFDAGQLPGATLRATIDDPGQGSADDFWRVLPTPPPRSPALDALVQRDAAANLPALAARQLLDDAEQFGSELGGLLERTMARLLANDDLATATWLLGEAQRQPVFDRAIARRLVAMARERCDEHWLRAQVADASAEDLMALTSLVMQLGDDVAERFAAAAAEVAHPLTQWLCELLGRPS
ncbi:MAG: hypothetical protein R3F29_09855 [Planctomycetota bacterium]